MSVQQTFQKLLIWSVDQKNPPFMWMKTAAENLTAAFCVFMRFLCVFRRNFLHLERFWLEGNDDNDTEAVSVAPSAKDQYYKTFYHPRVCLATVSYRVCPLQTLSAWSNICYTSFSSDPTNGANKLEHCTTQGWPIMKFMKKKKRFEYAPEIITLPLEWSAKARSQTWD